jgi:hypothetical protein
MIASGSGAGPGSLVGSGEGGQVVAAADLARVAAEAIRQLNHATIHGRGYEWPGDVDDVVAELSRAASGMVQALDQASRWLTRAQAAGQVGHDQFDQFDDAAGGVEAADPAGAVAGAVAVATGQIARAARQATALSRELGAVQVLTSHLTGVDHLR